MFDEPWCRCDLGLTGELVICHSTTDRLFSPTPRRVRMTSRSLVLRPPLGACDQPNCQPSLERRRQYSTFPASVPGYPLPRPVVCRRDYLLPRRLRHPCASFVPNPQSTNKECISSPSSGRAPLLRNPSASHRAASSKAGTAGHERHAVESSSWNATTPPSRRYRIMFRRLVAGSS